MGKKVKTPILWILYRICEVSIMVCSAKGQRKRLRSRHLLWPARTDKILECEARQAHSDWILEVSMYLHGIGYHEFFVAAYAAKLQQVTFIRIRQKTIYSPKRAFVLSTETDRLISPDSCIAYWNFCFYISARSSISLQTSNLPNSFHLNKPEVISLLSR